MVTHVLEVVLGHVHTWISSMFQTHGLERPLGTPPHPMGNAKLGADLAPL